MNYIVILIAIDVIRCQPMKLNHTYQIDGSRNLTFRCPKSINRTLVIIQSNSDLSINFGVEVVQISDPEQNDLCIQMQINRILSVTLLLIQIIIRLQIETSFEFSILQQEFRIKQINLTAKPDTSIQSHLDAVTCFQFDIEPENQLFILELYSVIEALDQFQFILTSEIFTERYLLDRADNQFFYKLLQQQTYHLFIFSYSHLQFWFYYQKNSNDQFLFIKQFQLSSSIFQDIEVSDVELGRSDDPVYILVLQGEGIIKHQFDNEPIYLNSEQDILIIIEPKFILQLFSEDMILFHKSISRLHTPKVGQITICVRNNLFSMLMLKFPLHINVRIVENPQTLVQFQDVKYNRYFYIELNSSLNYLNLSINYRLIEVYALNDHYPFVIPSNQSLSFIVYLDAFHIHTQNGYFQKKILSENSFQISAQTYSVFRIREIIQKKFLRVQFGLIYKLHSSQLFFIDKYVWQYFIVNIQCTDGSIHFYKDQNLKQPLQFNDHLTKQAQENHYNIFITLKIHEICYIQFLNTLNRVIYIDRKQETIVLSGPFLYMYIQEFNAIQIIYERPVKYNLSYINDNIAPLVKFEINQLFCVLNPAIKNSQIIYKNQLTQLIEEKSVILMYITANHITIFFSQIESPIQMDFTIYDLEIYSPYPHQNKDIQLPRLNYNLSDNHIHIDLSFFDCESKNNIYLEYDCLLEVKLSALKYNTSVTFQTCQNIIEGVQQIEYLYLCNSLESIDIIPLQGTLRIYKNDHFIQCLTVSCLILFKQLNTTLQHIQNMTEYLFTLPLNQLHLNIISSFGVILFYINQTSLISIHSDLDQLRLTTLIDLITKEYTAPVILSEGYYYIQLLEKNCKYLTIFTYPTNLYQNISFRVTAQEQFTLMKISSYLLLDLKGLDYINSNLTINTSFNIQFINLSLINGDSITFRGNGTVTAHYINNLCIFEQEPRLIIFNDKFQLSGKISEQCKLLNLQIILDNQQFKTKFNEIFEFQGGGYSNHNFTLIIETSEYIYKYLFKEEFIQIVNFDDYSLFYLLIGWIFFLYYLTVIIQPNTLVDTDNRIKT